MRRLGLLALASALCATAFTSAAFSAAINPYDTFSLSTGWGDGDISVTVDPFGESTYGYFDPVGDISGGNVIYNSLVALTQGSFVTQLYSDTAVELVSQTATSLVTSFTINQLAFTLTQTVAKAYDDAGVQTGSVLLQSYAIQNTTNILNSFQMLRYLDGDLYLTDNSLADGGGKLGSGANIVLYETDATGEASDAETFVGITATGGTLPSNYFSVTRCCSISYPLDNTVTGDSDGDGFIDSVYDVTLQLARDFSIAPGATEVFTTATLFGNATPPAPGSSPTLPLLPSATEVSETGVPTWSFAIEVPVYTEDTRLSVWIDPEIAVGYTYTVTGAEFYAVTAPSLLAVNDLDGYTLIVGGVEYALAAGQTLTFTTGFSTFELVGIDPVLGLNPLDTTAFALEVTLGSFTSNTVIVTQTPIVINTDVAPVPLPATAPLLLAGLGAGMALRRLRRR